MWINEKGYCLKHYQFMMIQLKYNNLIKLKSRDKWNFDSKSFCVTLGKKATKRFRNILYVEHEDHILLSRPLQQFESKIISNLFYTFLI